MGGLAKLQLIGPTAVVVVILGAGHAAYALASAPTSEVLWYLNTEVFGAIRWSEDILTGHADIGHFQFRIVVLPISLMACSGFLGKRPLPLAIACNLSFVYASLLIYAFHAQSLSTDPVIASPRVSASYIVWYAFYGCTLLSFVASHIMYIRTICREYRGRRQSILQT